MRTRRRQRSAAAPPLSPVKWPSGGHQDRSPRASPPLASTLPRAPQPRRQWWPQPGGRSRWGAWRGVRVEGRRGEQREARKGRKERGPQPVAQKRDWGRGGRGRSKGAGMYQSVARVKGNGRQCQGQYGATRHVGHATHRASLCTHKQVFVCRHRRRVGRPFHRQRCESSHASLVSPPLSPTRSLCQGSPPAAEGPAATTLRAVAGCGCDARSSSLSSHIVAAASAPLSFQPPVQFPRRRHRPPAYSSTLTLCLEDAGTGLRHRWLRVCQKPSPCFLFFT